MTRPTTSRSRVEPHIGQTITIHIHGPDSWVEVGGHRLTEIDATVYAMVQTTRLEDDDFGTVVAYATLTWDTAPVDP